MLWYFEPLSSSGFDSGHLGYLVAGAFSITLLLVSVCIIAVNTGPAKISALPCPRLSIISCKTSLLKATRPHPGCHHNHQQSCAGSEGAGKKGRGKLTWGTTNALPQTPLGPWGSHFISPQPSLVFRRQSSNQGQVASGFPPAAEVKMRAG